MYHWLTGKPLSAILGVAHTLHADLVAFETRMSDAIMNKQAQVAQIHSEIDQHVEEKTQAASVRTFIEGLIKVV